MKVNFLNIQRQYQNARASIDANIKECLESGAYIGGPFVTKFERSVSEYLGVKHAVTCGNGTDALQLALKACGIEAGDEVITTPFSFFATAEAISTVGAVPVFADIRESDLNIDPEKIEAKITEKTKAVLPVHIFGAPCDMDSILDIAKRHSLRVIEDAAQAIGCEYKGKKAGAIGDIGCFSFYPTKNLGAFGDAGMMTTNDDDLAVMCSALKAHAGGKNGARAYEIAYSEPAPDSGAGISDDPLYDPYKYYNYLIGVNSRLDSMQAAVLLAKLPLLDGYNAARKRIADRYNEELAGLSGLRLPIYNDELGRCCWHQYCVLADDKPALADYLASREIATGAFYPVPLHLQKAFRGAYAEGECPVAESVCERSLCLPIYPELTDEEQGFVIDEIKSFLS